MIKEYYIWDIKDGKDDVHGDIIIVRAALVHNNMVSELPSTWDIFFFKNTLQIANDLVALAQANRGRWSVDFSEFRESRVDFEGQPKKIFYHKSLPKKNFWRKLFGK
jgi:hypothetical protein